MKHWIMILAITSPLLPGLTADEPKAPEAEPDVAIVLGPARGNAIPSREASGQTAAFCT